MPHDNRPFLVGLTGGVASGKSTVAAMLREHGFEVVQSDLVAHEALAEPETIRRLTERFGEGILREGRVDRKALGEIVFADSAARADLNSIVHPRVRARLDEIVAGCKSETLVIEIPLLFDSGLGDRFDCVATVEADMDLRLRALMKRDGLSREQAEARVASQITERQRRELAQYVIVNPMEITGLHAEVDRFVSWLHRQEKRSVKNFTA